MGSLRRFLPARQLIRFESWVWRVASGTEERVLDKVVATQVLVKIATVFSEFHRLD